MKRRDFITTAAAVGTAGIPALTTVASADAADGGDRPAPLPMSGRAGAASPGKGLITANLRGPGDPRLAVKVDKGLLDVTAAAKALGLRVPQNTDELINSGEGDLHACVARALKEKPGSWIVSEDAAAFAPAVLNPQKIVCIGINYRRHARETGIPEPKAPILFTKFNNSLTHHRAVVPTQGLPNNHFDYEVELVIVMGERCVHVSEARALDYVYGYCTGNDFSERLSQFITSQWLAGKSSDGFAPLGPYLVSADLVGDPDNLRLTTHVNGEKRQDSNTSDMIYNCQKLVSYCSSVFPLEPGDIIYTGTPEGVVLGMPKERQVWLKPGDKVVTAIEKLGALEITVG